jgi:hypothetical protein
MDVVDAHLVLNDRVPRQTVQGANSRATDLNVLVREWPPSLGTVFWRLAVGRPPSPLRLLAICDPLAAVSMRKIRSLLAPGLLSARTFLADRVRAGAAWVVERRLVLAVGLIAAIPVVSSTAHAVLAGWAAVFDDAIIATNSFDVLNPHPRLLGIYSEASLDQVGPVFGPGPMLLWLLALPARVPNNWALPLTVGLLNTMSIMAMVALAHRRGGQPFMFMTAIALAFMCGSLPSETWHDVLNPSFALLPFTLLLFLAWSLACGDYRLLPLTILVASFVVQAHFSMGLASVATVAVGLGGLAISAMGSSRRTSGTCRRSKRWLFGAIGVALVCWSAPLVDQTIHRPGNLVSIVETATAGEPKIGASSGWNHLVKTVGVWPWWLKAPSTGPERLFGALGTPPAAARASCVVILGGFAIVMLLGLRRRRADIIAAATLGLVLSAMVVVTTASVPARLVLSIDKATRWTSPAGMFLWLTLGWSLAVLVWPWATRLRGVRRLNTLRVVGPRATASLVGLGITALVAVLMTARREPDVWESTYQPVNTIASRLSAQLPHSRPLLVQSAGTFTDDAVQTALIYQLRRKGYQPVARGSPRLGDLVDKLGPSYSADRHPPKNALFIDDRHMPARFSGARVLARIRLTPGGGAEHDRLPPSTITVSLVPVAELLSGLRQGQPDLSSASMDGWPRRGDRGRRRSRRS